MDDIDHLAKLARYFSLLDAYRAGVSARDLALSEGVTVRRINQIITEVSIWDGNGAQRIKLPREDKSPITLEMLFPMNGLGFTPTSPCPTHPGEHRDNPRYKRWRSKLCCAVCNKSGSDHRLWRNKADDPKPEAKLAEPIKPKANRRERRKALQKPQERKSA